MMYRCIRFNTIFFCIMAHKLDQILLSPGSLLITQFRATFDDRSLILLYWPCLTKFEISCLNTTDHSISILPGKGILTRIFYLVRLNCIFTIVKFILNYCYNLWFLYVSICTPLKSHCSPLCGTFIFFFLSTNETKKKLP